MTIVTYTRNGTDYSVDTAALPPVAVEYLLQYGWRQSLQDSIAGLEKATKEDFIARKDAAAEKGEAFDEDLEATVATAIDARLQQRAKAIADGSVTTSRAPRETVDPFANMCYKVAAEYASAAVKAANVKRPKGDDWNKLVAAVLAAHKAKIEKDARKRLDAAAANPVDLAAIMAQLG